MFCVIHDSWFHFQPQYIFERQIYLVFVSFILHDRDFNLMTSFLISFCDKF